MATLFTPETQAEIDRVTERFHDAGWDLERGASFRSLGGREIHSIRTSLDDLRFLLTWVHGDGVDLFTGFRLDSHGSNVWVNAAKMVQDLAIDTPLTSKES